MIRHDFIEVKNRRWCIGCSTFQSRDPGAEFPVQREDCARNTQRAIDEDARAARKELTTP